VSINTLKSQHEMLYNHLINIDILCLITQNIAEYDSSNLN